VIEKVIHRQWLPQSHKHVDIKFSAYDALQTFIQQMLFAFYILVKKN
jgi:hypothetical protein